MTFGATLVAAVTTGLLGSLHCVAMCGPLAAAGCSTNGRVTRREALGYFGGRLVSYAAVGAVLGTVGHHAHHILPMGTVQTAAAITVAAVAAARGVQLLWLRRQELVQLGGEGASPTLTFLGRILPKRGLGLGLVTGVLPCGLLVAGWALAAGTAHPVSGAIVMALFSVATAPGLVLPVVGQRVLSRWLHRIPRVAHGLAWMTLAVWLALRPLMVSAHAGH